MDVCRVANTTVKKFETAHPGAWKCMKYAFDHLFAKDDKHISGSSKVDKKWSLNQIEKIVHFELRNEDDEELEAPTMFGIEFKFILKDCRMVSGTVRNTMPCSCCFQWVGSASVQAD
uniref:Uncharacterized protein n=1 Tax=Clandestinovirus TaxID=2831644 RepID=A0A8F8KLB6_9VIRU|nr:hypothetical protein KOM_12_195 [Clandestinovirus]